MNKTIYLAGGCFWGVQHLFSSLNGVIETKVGYINGSDVKTIDYKSVKTGTTGFKEAVKIIYDDSIISLEHILFIFFYIIDPTQKDGQKEDIGSQYICGIYYIDEESKKIIDKIYNLEKSFYQEFYVENEELRNFINAEEYHQDYLIKNKDGYCHIPFYEMNKIKNFKFIKENYIKSSKLIVR